MLDFASDDYERQIITRLLEEAKETEGRILRHLDDEEYRVVCRLFLRALEQTRNIGVKIYVAIDHGEEAPGLSNN